MVFTDDPVEAAENLFITFDIDKYDRVDGVIDGSRPAVHPTGMTLCTMTGGTPTVILSAPCKAVLVQIIEGVAFQRIHEIIQDDKLQVALELYGAHFQESSTNARFLTLVMALEALTDGDSRPQRVLNLLKAWKSQVDDLLCDDDWSEDDIASIEALQRELLFKREDSIRKQIYRLVFSTLQQAGDADAEVQAKGAQKLYDLRSTLVHDGKLPKDKLSFAVNSAKQLVGRVLRARFLAEAN